MSALQQFQYVPAATGPDVTITVSGKTVTASAAADGATSWLWNFGDGTTSTARVPPPKTYPGPGPYTITLKTTYITADGCRQYDALTVRTVRDTGPPPFICYERAVKVKQAKGQAAGPLGMAQSGAAFAARAAWLAGLLAYQVDNLQGRTPSTSIYYDNANPLPLFGGVGSAGNPDPFSVMRVVDAVVTTGLNGRFNTSSASNGNWLESDTSFEITLSTPHTAFGCYVMDLGDPAGDDEGATLEVDFFNGATLLETVVVPHNPPDSPSSDEAMWMGYENTAVPFNRISFRITQSEPSSGDFDYIGFDDFTIGTHLPCVPA